MSFMHYTLFTRDDFCSDDSYELFILDHVLEEEQSATTIQALARGVLTRRKVHFALLSADPDALARIM